MQIRPFENNQLEAVVRLSLRAWAPVFDSMQRVMKPEVYREFYPESWQASQQRSVEDVCRSEEMHVWVAVDNDETAGFVALKLHTESKLGEIYMIAVDPDYQKRGVAAALMNFAVDRMKSAGMSLAVVETGGDAGHAPARRLYERTGFDLFPIARYFKKL